MKVEVDSEDLKWILTMPGWEFNDEAIKKTDEVTKRLWGVLGVIDAMDQITKRMAKQKEMDAEAR